ncbi:recombination-associated protein RdgC [Cedecea neteri]|uniref:recombination-associated protein RdgC n=1 Tax=Cedecea neteri TaxID=158822 RepID=UPI002AA84657|nr:recombination-associated protein RdgC [Cedecea neteri]WPU24482.1 recombination-associated protein RdgC [Cedecea neteri]
MKFTKLKNAIVYRATLPAVETIGTHLAELPYADIGETEFSRFSFVENPITGEIVTPITGGYAVCLRADEKIIPAQIIKKEAIARISSIEGRLGQRISKVEKQQIIDTVKVDLCKQAFVKTSLIYALYHTEERLLMVNTTSQRYAGILGAMLVKVVGSIKTETIHISDIKNGLTTRLKNYIGGDTDAFDGFEVGDVIQLSRRAESKETIRYSAEHQSVVSEIEESLGSGFTVDSIQLFSKGTGFVLTENFHFRRIDTKSTDRNDGDDKAFIWRQAAGTDLFLMAGVVNKLCNLLCYKEEGNKESQDSTTAD